MAHKSLTISEDAYNALRNLKNENESFTDVILRLSKQNKMGKLSELIRKIAPDHELADNIEHASRRLRNAKVRKVNF